MLYNNSSPYVSYDMNARSLKRFFKNKDAMDLIVIINAFNVTHEACGFIWIDGKSEPEFMIFDNKEDIKILSELEEEFNQGINTYSYREIVLHTWKSLIESIDMTKVVWLLFSQKVRRGW